MTSTRSLSILSILVAATFFLEPCRSVWSAELPNAGSAPAGGTASVPSSTTINTLSSAYSNLQTIWDECYTIKGICDDLLNEGRNAPARKSWVDYYVSTAEQSVNDLQSEFDKVSFPPDLQSDTAAAWNDARLALKSMRSSLFELQTQAAKVKSPNDDKYPPIFWGASGGLADSAGKLDVALVDTLAVLDRSRDNSLLAMAPSPSVTSPSGSASPSGSSASATTLKGGATKLESGAALKYISEAAKRTRKSCFQLFGELERFNLLFANPPKGEQSNMFYGGAFTKQEVLSQYKYMPNLVFTSAPYVKLFSYRLPPRQNMLASYTRQIGKLLNLMESELNDIHIPPEKAQAVAGPWEAVKAQFVDARQQYLALYKQVEATSDQRLQANIAEDQGSLGAPTMKIYDDMQNLLVAADDVNVIINGK